MAGIHVVKGKYAHLGWVDIEGNGVATEVAIIKNGPQGLYFIRINKLDMIDKQRLFRIINNRNAHLYELWDLMSNITLGNGANALEYFHQYVKVLTPSRQVLSPSLSRMVDPRWTGVQQRQQRHQVQQQAPQQQQAQMQQPTQQQSYAQQSQQPLHESTKEEKPPFSFKKRGPGRPRKTTNKPTGA